MDGFGPEVKRRIMTGVSILSKGYQDKLYHKAQQVRTILIEEFTTTFQKVDVLLTPVSPTAAFKVGAKKDPIAMYQEDIFLTPSSLAGVCGISIPIGKNKDNLPIGAHFIGPAFREDLILQVGHQIQSQN
jgi:aspartyl-tRNA(Asn)/glutamyl-tRNA(Gln) amidotransferase subunit A